MTRFRTPQLVRCLAVALGMLTVAGCGSAGDGSSTEESSSALGGGRKGVDYSWARPSPSGLHADGYTFAARYLSYDNSGKNISRGEADALIAAGVDVVSNWEESATAALGGFGQGASDARAAESEALAAGMPAGRPIYFSIDFDATPGDQGAIDAYFDGVASVLGRNRTGAYGGFYPIERLFNAGKITWAWQTYAWSGGQWDPRAQLRQVQNGVNVAGGACDIDQAEAADFGQWGHSAPPHGPPTPKPPAPTGCGTIEPGHGLSAGESFESCDHRFTLAMQTDGNLVLYMGPQALWATGTNGNGDVAVMQGDGNFVEYGKYSDALWASGTNGHDNSTLVIQDDGNLVVYAPGGHPTWATGTNLPASPPKPTGCGTIYPGQGLTAGESFGSCDGRFALVMQTDGNLVLYEHSAPIWATGTYGKPGYMAIMQGDGNFVLYDRHERPLWASNTNGHGGADLAVQTDGNLVVYAPGGHPVWASNTCCR